MLGKLHTKKAALVITITGAIIFLSSLIVGFINMIHVYGLANKVDEIQRNTTEHKLGVIQTVATISSMTLWVGLALVLIGLLLFIFVHNRKITSAS